MTVGFVSSRVIDIAIATTDGEKCSRRFNFCQVCQTGLREMGAYRGMFGGILCGGIEGKNLQISKRRDRDTPCFLLFLSQKEVDITTFVQ